MNFYNFSSKSLEILHYIRQNKAIRSFTKQMNMTRHNAITISPNLCFLDNTVRHEYCFGSISRKISSQLPLLLLMKFFSSAKAWVLVAVFFILNKKVIAYYDYNFLLYLFLFMGTGEYQR
jgi:hypothetical protein